MLLNPAHLQGFLFLGINILPIILLVMQSKQNLIPMKKNFFKTAVLLFSVVFIFSACSKEDDDDNNGSTSKTNSEYLTSGYWKISAMTIDPGVNFGGTVITDFYAQIPACTKDDLIKFNADGTITDDEGTTKCNPNDPQTTNDGTWVMSQDNQSFTVNYPDEDPITFSIIDLNDNTFKGSYTAVEDFGSGPLTYTYTVTMTRQ